MSRYEITHTGTFFGAGFSLPFFGAKVYPDFQTFSKLSSDYDYLPIYTQVTVNKLNITGFYKKIHSSAPSCLLESLSGNDNGRYSIIANHALHQINCCLDNGRKNDPVQQFLTDIRVPALDFPFFTGGLVGYWTYEAGLLYQDMAVNKAGLKYQHFFMPDEIIVYDRHKEVLTIILWLHSKSSKKSYLESLSRLSSLLDIAGNCRVEEEANLKFLNTKEIDKDFDVNIDTNQFKSLVKKAQTYIKQGDIFQIVLSRRWKKQSSAEPWNVYRVLRRLNPSPYMFYFNLQDKILMGASPEMQVKVENNHIQSRPIAGTRKISGNKSKDLQMSQELLNDEKEKSEHLMLLDLSRNDIGKVCQTASVRVREFMNVEHYSHVMHLVSTVEGQLKSNKTAIEAFQNCFPAGTLTGAPKRKAMEIIEQLEEDPRGPYGGAAGFIGFNNFLDSCISIRAILYKNGIYYLQSGAGIVADSLPESECKETLNKAKVLMLAIKEAEELQ